MATAAEVMEKVNKTFNDMKEINERALAEFEKRGTEATSETREMLDAVKTDLIEARKEMKDIQTRMSRPEFAPEAEDVADKKLHTRAFEIYCRAGMKPAEDSKFQYSEEMLTRGLSSWSDGSGGFLIPVDYEGGVIMNAYDLAELRPICQVGTTGRDVVQLGALSKPSVGWSPAGIQITDQTLTAGTRRLQVYTLYGLTTVNNDTLDDAEANLEQELSGGFSRAIAEAEDDAYAAGAGDDRPEGVVANEEVQANYVATGVAADISDATNNGMDAMRKVLYTPKKTYRRNGTWAMNSTTESEFLNLKDGEGRYLWQPNIQVDRPPTLYARPIVNPEGMPDIAAGAYPVAFGDFMAGYKIRDNGGLSVMRLVERYADYDQTGFMVKKRTSGKVTLSEAFAVLKVAAS